MEPLFHIIVKLSQTLLTRLPITVWISSVQTAAGCRITARTLTPRNPRSAFRRQIEDLVSLNDFLIVSNGSKTCEGWPRRPGP